VVGGRRAVCAAGEAAWHAAAYAGLGVRWSVDRSVAWSRSSPHPYLFAAVTLRPDASIPSGVEGRVRDSWGALVGEELPGWRPCPAGPWMFRDSSRCPVEPPAGVVITATQDPLLFERIAFLAAGGRPPQRAGELHPPGSQHYPGLHLYLAWRGERAIGTALALIHETGIAVSALAVLAPERRQGIGAALTATALQAAPGLPATLSTSQIAAPTYRRLGFIEVGTPVDWVPPNPERATP